MILCEDISCEVIWELGRVKDVITEYWKQKFHEARDVAKFADNRWNCRIVK